MTRPITPPQTIPENLPLPPAGVLCPARDRHTVRLAAAVLAVCLMSGQAIRGGDLGGTGGLQSLDNWMTLDGQPVTEGWEIADGVIHLRSQKPRAGHIVTRDEFTDFVLTFDWKIAPGGNSGIKYRVRDFDGRVLGCEYQIFDDVGARKSPAANKGSGSLYDVVAPNTCKFLHPVGEFNSARIVVRGDRIEHWLNGNCILCICVGSPRWQQLVAESKFSDVPGFGENRSGRIMLTDHGSDVWYRNLRLTPLPPCP